MYHLLLVLLTVLGITTTTYAQENQNMNKTQSSKRVLIVYFSATGTTTHAAEKLANITGGKLYAITPVQAYTSADLDWHNKQSRSSVEMNDPEARPALNGNKLNTSDYDVVFIGYPIWWDLAPRIINTFIESHDLKSKILVPFATSGGSSITNSVKALKKSYPDLNWKEGKLLNRVSESSIREWIEDLKY